MACDACGTKSSASWMNWNEVWNLEGEILAQFASQKSGRNQKAFRSFHLCGNCCQEYKKFLSITLKTKLVSELADKNSIDCYLFFQYNNHSSLFESDDWFEVRKTLSENIQRYKNEWQIKEMNYNRDGKEYFHPESNRKRSKLIVLIHQSAPVEYTYDGFLIIKSPKMYLKEYFPSEQWSQTEKNLSQSSSAKPQFPLKTVLTIGGVFLVVGVVFWFLFYYQRKKNK